LKNNRILIIGPFPNPISGVSLANKVVKEVLENTNNFQVSVINTSYTVFEDAVGSFSWHKLFFFLKLNSKAFKIFSANIVYITPGQTFFGILKYTLYILLASLLQKELIIHVHGNYLGQQYKELTGVKKKIFYFLVSKFTKGIVLSASLKLNLTPFIPLENIHILYNFAEDYLLEKQNKEHSDTLKICYLSNLMEEKGITFLLESLNELEQRNISYTAKIAGNIDIVLEKEILAKIKNLKNTTYLGVVYKQEKRNLLEWSTIFVLPTFYKMEGQPIAILEALATGNVIITTNHAGIPDIITNKIHGSIIAKKSTKSLLDAIIYYSKNKSEILEISKKNKMYFAENFTLHNFSLKLKEILYANTTTK
jgi:glycosyltransferase involved in cell wall biosynthesis